MNNINKFRARAKAVAQKQEALSRLSENEIRVTIESPRIASAKAVIDRVMKIKSPNFQKRGLIYSSLSEIYPIDRTEEEQIITGNNIKDIVSKIPEDNVSKVAYLKGRSLVLTKDNGNIRKMNAFVACVDADKRVQAVSKLLHHNVNHEI